MPSTSPTSRTKSRFGAPSPPRPQGAGLGRLELQAKAIEAGFVSVIEFAPAPLLGTPQSLQRLDVDDVLVQAFQALRALVPMCHQQHGDAKGMPDLKVVIRIANE